MSLNRIRALRAVHGDSWPAQWLIEKGLTDYAEQWKRYSQTHSPHHGNIVMHPKFKRTVLIMLCATAMTVAHASGVVAGVTLPEQLIQEIPLTDQLAQQVITAENSLKNLTSAFSGAGALQGWQVDQITAQLSNLVNIIAQAQGVSYPAQNTAQQVTTVYGDPTLAITDYQ